MDGKTVFACKEAAVECECGEQFYLYDCIMAAASTRNAANGIIYGDRN